MSLTHGSNIVTDSLLLNLDFKNPKKFSSTLGTGNLAQAFTWNRYFPENNVYTTGIDAPDGSMTAVRMSCRTTGSSVLRCTFTTPFTPNGTDTYVVSFYVRKISGTTSSSGQLTYDLADATPSGDYLPQLVTGKWVRVVVSAVPTAVVKSFFDVLSDNTNDYVLDFWGVKVENITAVAPMPFKDTVGGYTMNAYRPQYYTVNDDSITFTRSASTPKDGPCMYLAATSNLAVANFMYNNFTWEVWFKINDINPGVYAGNGAWNNLMSYRGWHSGFIYNANTMQFVMWSGASTSVVPASWTVAASGAQLNQGNWYQVVLVRTGDVFTPYVNGVGLGTGSTTATTVTGINVQNDIFIGGVGAGAGSGAIATDYNYFPKHTIANSKMYNRALTAAEVLQNFNALRGRFGI
jgi:hypothetical protein